MSDKDLFQTIDLSNIKNKFVYVYKWSENEASSCEKLYKNFLHLSHIYFKDKKLVPTHEIDLFWHEHILDTEKYRRDCNELFGDYLDHYPSYNFTNKIIQNSEHQKLFKETQMLHKKHFGYYMYDIRVTWPKLIKIILSRIFKR